MRGGGSLFDFVFTKSRKQKVVSNAQMGFFPPKYTLGESGEAEASVSQLLSRMHGFSLFSSEI